MNKLITKKKFNSTHSKNGNSYFLEWKNYQNLLFYLYSTYKDNLGFTNIFTTNVKIATNILKDRQINWS